MRQKEIELLCSYFLNNLTLLEGEIITARNNIRYREVDSVDCLEMILSIERKETFVRTMQNVFSILNIRSCELEEDDK